MKLSLILQAIDRMSGPARKAKAGLDDLGRRGFGALDKKVEHSRGEMRGFVADSQRGERDSRRLGYSLRALMNQGYGPLGARIEQTRHRMRLFATDSGFAERAASRFGSRLRRVAESDFAALTRGATRARTAMRGLFNQSMLWGARQLGSAVRFGALGVGAGAVAAGGLFTRGVIGNAAKFEQYQVALEGTEGSATKAKAAMAWVQKFAKDTPYDIDTVTDSFVRARGVGIDPMTGAFRILGDAAGGTRKSLMDAVEAMADAQTGEFERLKEFSITTSIKGDRATFSYIDKAGKNASVSVKKSMSTIRGAILDIFDKKYGGGMERQSKTLTGIWNNLQDVLTNFELKVADAGIFDRVKSGLQGVLTWTDSIAKDGRLDVWAKQASDKLGEVWDAAQRFITQTDWRSVASGVGTIAAALTNVLGAIGRVASAWSRWQNNVERDKLDTIINGKGVWGSGWGEASPQEKADARQRLGQLDREQYGQPQVRTGGNGQAIWPGTAFARRTPTVTTNWQSPTRGVAAGTALLWQRGLQARAMTPTLPRPSPARQALPRPAPTAAQQPSSLVARAGSRSSPWTRPAPMFAPVIVWPRGGATSPRTPPPKPPKPGKVAVDITLKGPAAQTASVGALRTSGDVKATVNRGWAMGVHL